VFHDDMTKRSIFELSQQGLMLRGPKEQAPLSVAELRQ
jgi:hypothetical protein